MPLIFQQEDDDKTVVVWQITEPISFFLDHLPLNETDLPSAYPERNAQWLTARYLLHELIDQPEIHKDKHQKPHLINDPRYISISHSFDVAAVMVAHVPCGIDIEKDLPRLQRIATKFVNPGDLILLLSSPSYNDLLYQTWCAKEAMYKAYGLGQIDFKKNLIPDMNAILNKEALFNGSLIKETVHLSFKLNYEKINHQYHMVYGILQ